MGLGPPPAYCMNCRHYRGLSTGPASSAEPALEPDTLDTCAAFPKGIPAGILDGRFDHTQPHTGDHGIRFEPVDPQGSQPSHPPAASPSE